MLVFALILLFFANNQSPGVLFDTSWHGGGNANGQYLPAFPLGMFMALFVVYGFDTAGTFGEETLDASRQAPRGVLWSIWISGLVGAIFLLAVILAIPDMPAAIATGQAFGFPIATRSSRPHRHRRPGSRSARSTCSSSSPRSSSARWRSRARRPG